MIAEIIHYFEVGGWCMYAIAACSVVALGIFLERLWTLRASSITPPAFLVEVRDLVTRGQIPEAITLCRKTDSPLSHLILAALESAGISREQIKERVFEVGEWEVVQLKAYMGALNLIISIAPMFGFLGTVIGMVDLFSNVAAVGEVTSIGIIADGIYKALYTTVYGLIVAIPATLFYRYLSSKIDRTILTLEECSLQIVDLLKR